jgi:hypothetical protein
MTLAFALRSLRPFVAFAVNSLFLENVTAVIVLSTTLLLDKNGVFNPSDYFLNGRLSNTVSYLHGPFKKSTPNLPHISLIHVQSLPHTPQHSNPVYLLVLLLHHAISIIPRHHILDLKTNRTLRDPLFSHWRITPPQFDTPLHFLKRGTRVLLTSLILIMLSRLLY